MVNNLCNDYYSHVDEKPFFPLKRYGGICPCQWPLPYLIRPLLQVHRFESSSSTHSSTNLFREKKVERSIYFIFFYSFFYSSALIRISSIEEMKPISIGMGCYNERRVKKMSINIYMLKGAGALKYLNYFRICDYQHHFFDGRKVNWKDGRYFSVHCYRKSI